MRSDYLDIVRSKIADVLQDKDSDMDIVAQYSACAQAIGETMEEIRRELQNGLFTDKTGAHRSLAEILPRPRL